jgi:ParB-like chromosome segregation protein Spo0J
MIDGNLVATTTNVVALSKISVHPRNVRQGDIGAISESLSAHGQYRPLVVQKSSGHILAGNHTYMAAKALGWPKIAVVYVDVDDEEALRILLVDNRTNDLASYDEHALSDLLAELGSTDQGLQGTGYTVEELDDMLNDINGDTSPMLPSYQYNVLVNCADETQQAELLTRFEAEGLTCKAIVA